MAFGPPFQIRPLISAKGSSKTSVRPCVGSTEASIAALERLVGSRDAGRADR